MGEKNVVTDFGLKRGVLYRRGGKRRGTISVSKIVVFLKTTAMGLKLIGGVVMVLAGVGMAVVWGPVLAAEVGFGVKNFQFSILNSQSNPNEVNFQVQNKTLSTGPGWAVPDQDYSIYIPKIGAVSRVIGNVDAGNKKEYLEALTRGVAEAMGLAHPGEVGTTYLFAHSTDSPANYARYNAVFYLLDKLDTGDEVEVVYKGRRYRYAVEGKQRLRSGDVRYLIPQKSEELLVLSTCWPPGTSYKRLVLTAKRVMVY